jgi:hypothetical protein
LQQQSGAIAMSVQEIVAQVRHMSRAERTQLMHELVDVMNLPAPQEKPYNIMDFRGIGSELADGMDAQEYVNQLRSEWDHRP